MAVNKAIPNDLTNMRIDSSLSSLPTDWAVSPPVAMRRNPNTQYITLNIIPPTAMAPIYAAAPRCPTIAMSISPSRGTVILLIIAGTAISNICLSHADRRQTVFKRLIIVLLCIFVFCSETEFKVNVTSVNYKIKTAKRCFVFGFFGLSDYQHQYSRFVNTILSYRKHHT